MPSVDVAPEHVRAEVANNWRLAVKVPQNQVVVGTSWISDGDCPHAARANQAATHPRVPGVGFDAIEPGINQVRQVGMVLVQAYQGIARLGIHLQHTAHITRMPRLPH